MTKRKLEIITEQINAYVHYFGYTRPMEEVAEDIVKSIAMVFNEEITLEEVKEILVDRYVTE